MATTHENEVKISFWAQQVVTMHEVRQCWPETRKLIEHMARMIIIYVDEDDSEARYYGLRGWELVRSMLADRVLIALSHPPFTGDEDHAALLGWCAEWTREAALQ